MQLPRRIAKHAQSLPDCPSTQLRDRIFIPFANKMPLNIKMVYGFSAPCEFIGALHNSRANIFAFLESIR